MNNRLGSQERNAINFYAKQVLKGRMILEEIVPEKLRFEVKKVIDARNLILQAAIRVR